METSLPGHIAIIPDGNRRWAKGRGLLPTKGHEKGGARFDEISEAAFAAGVEYFTIWAGSEDNLTKRSPKEILFLVQYLKHELERQLRTQRLEKAGVKFRLIGRWYEILKDDDLKSVVNALERATKNCAKHQFTILFGYDGRQEMLLGIEDLMKNPPGKVTFDVVKERLMTGELPPVDLVIRTGGEPHWSSGFLMWHTTDSQLYFTDMLWPDFDAAAF